MIVSGCTQFGVELLLFGSIVVQPQIIKWTLFPGAMLPEVT
jgi:hypothetical protein